MLDRTGVIGAERLDVNADKVRAAYSRSRPSKPQPFGPAGFAISLHTSSGTCNGTIIVSQAEHDGAEWIHASIARNTTPTYADLAQLKDAVFGPDRYAFQVFPSADRHVNIHPHALHLWGRADGANLLPDFGKDGTI